MWLLRLHFAISVLCLITFVGFGKVFKEQIKENGWKDDNAKKKGKISGYMIFFVPIMNIIAVLIVFVMIGMKKSEFDKMKEESEKTEENNTES